MSITDIQEADTQSRTQNSDRRPTRSSMWLGILPFIGVILFLVNAPIFGSDRTGNWKHQALEDAVVYMIGWAGVGAAVSHVIFGNKISKSIGFQRSPFEVEVGFASLGTGVAALMAGGRPTSFLLALIVASSIFRIGCGLQHVRQIISARNYSVNNTAILLINFAVPAFLFWAYRAWA